jgi:hypothetical protein
MSRDCESQTDLVLTHRFLGEGLLPTLHTNAPCAVWTRVRFVFVQVLNFLGVLGHVLKIAEPSRSFQPETS